MYVDVAPEIRRAGKLTWPDDVASLLAAQATLLDHITYRRTPLANILLDFTAMNIVIHKIESDSLWVHQGALQKVRALLQLPSHESHAMALSSHCVADLQRFSQALATLSPNEGEPIIKSIIDAELQAALKIQEGLRKL